MVTLGVQRTVAAVAQQNNSLSSNFLEKKSPAGGRAATGFAFLLLRIVLVVFQ
jgi:hypothetical protein